MHWQEFLNSFELEDDNFLHYCIDSIIRSRV